MKSRFDPWVPGRSPGKGNGNPLQYSCLGDPMDRGGCHVPAIIVSVQSVQFSRSILCNPMNRSTSGLPVHHQLPELTQIHVHWVDDAIQSSHPLSSPSPPAFNLSRHQSFPVNQFFASGGQSIGVSASASVLPMNIQDWFLWGWTGLNSLQQLQVSLQEIIVSYKVIPQP